MKKGQVLAVLALGGTRAMAARFVGCTTMTIRNEVRRDPRFAEALAKAVDSSEMVYLQSIRKAAKETRHWRAAAWALERARPERYAPRGPDVITFAQMRRFIARIVEIVSTHVPERYRKLILDQLDAASGDLQAGAKPTQGT